MKFRFTSCEQLKLGCFIEDMDWLRQNPKGGIYCKYFQNRLMLSKLKSGKSYRTLCQISCQNWILLPFPIPVIDMICKLGPSSIIVLPQRISTATYLSMLDLNDGSYECPTHPLLHWHASLSNL